MLTKSGSSFHNVHNFTAVVSVKTCGEDGSAAQ